MLGKAVKSYGGPKSRSAKEKEAKDVALKSLIKSGKGVTVIGKDSQRKSAFGAKGSNDTRKKPISGGDMASSTKWKL